MQKRLLSAFLAVFLGMSCLSMSASANADTTTYGTAYKTLDPQTEIYTVSDSSASYPYYGALYEPTSGSYFGRVADAGMTENGFGLVTGDGLANESACSFYYSFQYEQPLSVYSYLFEDLLRSGERAFVLNLNFQQEADDCAAILAGKYEDKLIETFTYLSTLSAPVFCRIGGEMNVWPNKVDPLIFQQAYRRVAEKARLYAPNVALVFSPNYSSGYETDMDSYYPGNSYVDWVGASLYYNQYSNNGDTANDAFYGVGAYGDALLNIQQVVNLSTLHNKPIIVTEGGSATSQNNRNTTAFAAERVERAYSFLTMVYPQIKALIYSDTNFNLIDNTYSITNNSVVTAAYDKAVSNNPTLRKTATEAVPYYTKLSDDTRTWKDTKIFTAYSYSSSRLTATWSVDGTTKHVTSQYPYRFALDCNSLSAGKHTLRVTFSDGNTKAYTFSSAKYYTATVFEDVPDNIYYTDAVSWAAENNITTGTSEKLFSPDIDCSRAQVVTFLWRAAGCPEPSGGSPFADVQDSDDYSYKAILWAGEKGITNGTSEGIFSPDAMVSRAQFVTFLWRMQSSPAPSSSESSFWDVQDGGMYYYNAVLWAVEQGITNGTDNGVFSPNNACTRAQVVTFLYRNMK